MKEKTKRPIYPIPFKEKCIHSKLGIIFVAVGGLIQVGLMIPMVANPNIGFGAISLLVSMFFTAWPLLTAGIILRNYGDKRDIARYEREHGINPSNENNGIEEKPISSSEIPINGETEEEKQYRIEQENDAQYQKGLTYYNSNDYLRASAIFKKIINYKDSKNLYNECISKNNEVVKEEKYNKALDLYSSGNYKEAYRIFNSLNDYQNSKNKALECKQIIDEDKAKTKKKVVTIICLSGLVVALCIGGIITIKSINKNKIQGNGTIDDPYLIKSMDQLRKNSKANAYYKLTDDITLTDNDLKEIVSVDYHLDGNGKKLSYEGTCVDPLFDNVTSDGTIKNIIVNLHQNDLTLNEKKDYSLIIGTNEGTISDFAYTINLNATYNGNYTLEDYSRIAPINKNRGTINNLDISATIDISSNSKYIEVSGLCNYNNGSIKNSKSYVTLNAPVVSAYVDENDGIIDNCTSAGFVTGRACDKEIDVSASGIAAFNKVNGQIINSTSNAYCHVACDDGYHGYSAGVCFMNYGLIKNCSADGEISVTGYSGEPSQIFMAASGICDYNYKDIENCVFAGILLSNDTGSSSLSLSGIVALNDTGARTIDCSYVPKYSNPIRFSASNGTIYVAGVLTYNFGTCSGCYCSISSVDKLSTATIYFSNSILYS